MGLNPRDDKIPLCEAEVCGDMWYPGKHKPQDFIPSRNEAYFWIPDKDKAWSRPTRSCHNVTFEYEDGVKAEVV